MSETKPDMPSCLCPAKDPDASPATPARKQLSETPEELATSLEPETPAKLESRSAHLAAILGVGGSGEQELKPQDRPPANAVQRAASGSSKDLPPTDSPLPFSCILLVRVSLGLDDAVMALAASSKGLMTMERRASVCYQDLVAGYPRCLFGYWEQRQNFLFWFASRRHVGLFRPFRSSFRINQRDLQYTYRITLMSPLKELCVETAEDLFFEKGRVLNQYGLDQAYELPDAIRRFKGSLVYPQRRQRHLRATSNYWFCITVSPEAASFTKCDGSVAPLRWGPDAWLIFRVKWCPQHHATYEHSVTGRKCVKFHVQRLD
eukprot:TRINITY_DN20120_c0_g2_i1.p1 TRINITY_DN20120_c0_g2~~TRINITY_DN20120_c0_g2_i1.p1  ORF type:complete len:319 (-),score=39.00 TRINITY_DN20120_c0_g2_i1:106-1062(-)